MKDFWAFPGPKTILGVETKRLEGTDLMDVGDVLVKVLVCHFKGLLFLFFLFNNGSWRSFCLYHSLLLPAHLAFPCQALPGEEASSPRGGPGVIGGPGLLLCSDWQDTWAAGALTGWTPCFVKLWLLLWFSIPWPERRFHPFNKVFVCFNFYWSIVDLQCCVSFRCTAK